MSARQNFQGGSRGNFGKMANLALGNLPALAGAFGGAALAAGVTVAIWSGEPSQAAANVAEPVADASSVVSAIPSPQAGSPQAASPKAASRQTTCREQTWPYINAGCLTGGVGQVRQVRVVATDASAPRTIAARAAHVEERSVPVQAAVIPPPAPVPQAAAIAATIPSAPIAQDQPYTKVTIRDGRQINRKPTRQALRAPRRATPPYEVLAGRPMAIHPAEQYERRAFAYGEEDHPRIVIVPSERGFGRW